MVERLVRAAGLDVLVSLSEPDPGTDSIVNMTTEAGDLNITFCPSGTSGFADLRRDAVDIEAADRLHVLVASQAAGREKDRLVLPRLRRLLDCLQDDA
jgi:hypothetical protein